MIKIAPDKQKHFLVGIVMGATLQILAWHLLPQHLVIGIVASFILVIFNDIAHFFTSDATSTLIIQREHTTITTSHHDRNEVINNNTRKLQDKIRNTIVGAGTLAGISEIQGGRLVKSFLEKEV